MQTRTVGWSAGRHDVERMTRRNAACVVAFGIGVLVFAYAVTDGLRAVVLVIGGIALLLVGLANPLPDRYRGVTVTVNRLVYITAPFLAALTFVSVTF